jgi:hypothetical protein
VIVNDALLTVWPFTVTENGPEIEPEGTLTSILVSLQVTTEHAVPLRDTVLLPCAEPKPEPAMATTLKTPPEVGVRLVMFRPSGTVKVNPLLATPLTDTTTFPVVVPAGTGTTIVPALQLVGVAVVPLNFTVLAPWVEPKFVPVMVTDVPTGPVAGDKLVRLGVGSTVKAEPTLANPFTVTTTFPENAPSGTGTTIEVALQLPGMAVVPLNVTALVPCVVPKFVPVIVTEAPTAPDAGDRFVMVGFETTVNVEPLLLTPLAFTTTLPVSAPAGTRAAIEPELQEVIVEAGVPLNVIVPVPCVVPKFAPAIVTDVPTGPVAGERLVMLGAGTTVKDKPLLETPLTATTTFPIVAPAGTVAAIEVCVQLEIVVAVVPLNFNVLVP